MDLTLIAAPYDLGREEVGSGRGPGALLRGGAVQALRARGHDVEVVTARRSAPFRAELEAVLEVDTAVAGLVVGAVSERRLPLVLAGNCNVSLGVHAGLIAAGGGEPTAVIWLDAHGDFHMPAGAAAGELDGMPLAVLTGRAHREVLRALGAVPQPEELTLHAGGRDLDPGEARALAASDIVAVGGGPLHEHLGERLAPALDRLAAQARSARGSELAAPPAYLHIDIDVLDPAVAPGVAFPCPGGLSLAELLAAVEMVTTRFRLRALSLASYAPQHDRGDATLRCSLAVLETATGG